jgi:nucleoside-diphosphate-sugar epimerase
LTSDLRPSFAGRSALVTGGLGFIGSHVARRLVELGAQVAVVDSLVPDYGGNPINVEDVRERISVTVADVCEPGLMRELVRGRDYVFNLAGQVSHGDSMEMPGLDLHNNCEAQLSILEACRRIAPDAKLVFASTRQVYGRPLHLPVDETHPCEPVDVNGVHKWAAERYHLLYDRVHGVRSACLRLTNTYGPGQLVKHSRQGLMGWFLRKVVEGGEIEIMGDGAQLRDFNYVDDVVEAMLRAAATPCAWGRVYNLGATPPVSLRELAELMLEIRGAGSYRLVPFPEERRRIDVGSVYLSYQKVRADLGWEPQVPLREGLTRAIRFYEKNLARFLA